MPKDQRSLLRELKEWVSEEREDIAHQLLLKLEKSPDSVTKPAALKAGGMAVAYRNVAEKIEALLEQI